jgi:NAD(P)H-hydrate epimerase
MKAISLSRQAVREYDREAIARGIPGPVLMENAARGAVELLTSLGAHGPITIVCGKGNNAGDGFVMARLLAELGFHVELELAIDPALLTGDAALAFAPLAHYPIQTHILEAPFEEGLLTRLRRGQWIVDALLGTGTQGAIREPFSSVIEVVNRARRRVLSVDLPSGLDCDSGEPLGPTIRANHTATFVARKLGFDNRASERYTGKVHVIPIGAGWIQS